MNNLRSELALKNNIDRHLLELSQLLGTNVQPEDLLSLQDTLRIRAESTRIVRSPLKRFEIPFLEKQGAHFLQYLRALETHNPSPVYVWTPLSNACGLLRPVALLSLNWGFDFSANREGVLALVTEDLADKLLLDYSDNLTGDRLIDVEATGAHWGQVQY